MLFLLNYEQFSIYFFLPFCLLYVLLSPLWFFYFPQKLLFLLDFSSFHKTDFLFKIIQHCETWNVIGLFPSYKLEEIELILFIKSYIKQIFVHQVCMNPLFYTVKLVESNKLYHTNRLM